MVENKNVEDLWINLCKYLSVRVNLVDFSEIPKYNYEIC